MPERRLNQRTAGRILTIPITSGLNAQLKRLGTYRDHGIATPTLPSNTEGQRRAEPGVNRSVVLKPTQDS